ncbi:aminotransferase class V-fold PLP-dependent enzyme [Oscillibacter sp.]|uniref:cysteine desulfurase family protein n=1 Tax=Oscillibacter sp. TaxID=1945593 RepID=UPI0033997208
MKQHIYADNAATTKLDKAAFEAMTSWLLEEYGNASQPYAFARKPKKALADARATIAECIGALPEEIYFTSGGTESNNWVIKSSAFSDPEKRATITSAFEHHAVLRSCAAIERLGYSVAYMWPSDEGYITPEALEKNITDNTRLVSVMLANNEIGSIQPIRELCEAAHVHGALFHTDAVQAVGHIKIDVHELGVDFLSASAHKFNGPKGIGFLYIRNGVELPPYADGGTQESAHRAGTENVAAIVSMATALKANCDLLEQNQQHILSLERQLISKLNESGVAYKRNGGDSKLPGLLSLSFSGKDGEAILHRTDLMGISLSTGSACDSVNTEISHVLQAIRLDEDYAKGTIRISLGKNNTEEEVERIAAALVKILL